jgi:hypothetical protein
MGSEEVSQVKVQKYKRDGNEDGIEPVEDPSVPGKQRTRVFHFEAPFE